MRASLISLALAAAFAINAPSWAATYEMSAGPVEITPVVTDLDEPWAVAFLPEGGFLITLRDGDLLHIDTNGNRQAVRGVPRVQAQGQGGLLDVLLPRDFDRTREVYLTYSKRQNRGSGTAVAKGILSDDGRRLRDVQVIWEMAPGTSGGRHFGSRLVEGRDGLLYVTIGDRGARDTAQSLEIETGSVVRISRDGQIPGDNPFVSQQGAQPGIWSYGHRNPQGAAMGPDGTLWVIEHGARGGDEVNRVVKGANYGWPVISYGTHYNGSKIGEGTTKTGLQQPAHYWDPSIAPSGATIYTGDRLPSWKGDMFVGSLKFGLISRLELGAGGTVREVERIDTPETERVRDVRTGPDGAIWFLSVGNETLYRMAPSSD